MVYLLFITSALDWLSTVYAVGMGSEELNPGHSYIMQEYGYFAFFLVRVVLIPCIVLLCLKYPFFDKYRHNILWLFSLVYLTAAIFNILQIIIYG